MWFVSPPFASPHFSGHGEGSHQEQYYLESWQKYAEISAPWLMLWKSVGDRASTVWLRDWIYSGFSRETELMGYIHKEIYFKELASTVVEAWWVQNPWSRRLGDWRLIKEFWLEFKGGQSVVEPRLVDVAYEIQRLSVAKWPLPFCSIRVSGD